MVGGDVRYHRHLRAPFHLHEHEAGQLHHHNVLRTDLLNFRQERPADVAAEVHGIPRRLQQPRDNAGSRGLAVRPGYGVDRRGTELEQQLHLGGDPDALTACLLQSRQGGIHPRRPQDQIHPQIVEVSLSQPQLGSGLFQLVGHRPDRGTVPPVAGHHPHTMLQELMHHRDMGPAQPANRYFSSLQRIKKSLAACLCQHISRLPAISILGILY